MMGFALNADYPNNPGPYIGPIDVVGVICNRLIECGVSGGEVYIANQLLEYTLPAVFVSETSLVGNVWDGLWETTVSINCIANSDYESAAMAYEVRRFLDGWGGGGIEDATHISTIPMQTTESNPTVYSRVVTFRTLHQERITA